MSSLPFSVSSTRNLLSHASSPSSRLRLTSQLVPVHKQQTSNARQKPKPEASGLLRRREAIGLGISFGVLETLFELSRDLSASAEGNGPCEFTVAPSGLAFCDKVPGYGPQAVQGQLIKVMQNNYYHYHS